MSRIVDYWKSSPRFRAASRAAAVAAIAYMMDVYRGTNAYVDLESFLMGLGGAAAYAVIGYFGLEPFVGVKPANVEVPSNADVIP